MLIGNRIKYIRNMRGLTQTQLGVSVGFGKMDGKVRISQYENGARKPKTKLTAALAQTLGVNPEALYPQIDNAQGTMHTLFALEDLYGLTIKNINGEMCLVIEKAGQSALTSMFFAWLQEAEKLRSKEITKEEYNNWRYNFPRSEMAKIEAYLAQKRKENKNVP